MLVGQNLTLIDAIALIVLSLIFFDAKDPMGHSHRHQSFSSTSLVIPTKIEWTISLLPP